jgi:hypothetical protein
MLGHVFSLQFASAGGFCLRRHLRVGEAEIAAAKFSASWREHAPPGEQLELNVQDHRPAGFSGVVCGW